MKNILKIFCVVLMLLTIPFISHTHYAAQVQNKLLFSDSKGIFLVNYSGKKAYVKELAPSSYNYTYTFSTKVINCCVVNSTAYILTENNSIKNSCDVYKAKDGSIIKELNLKNIKINNSSKISADKNGNIFIINSSKKVCVYNKDGSYLNTFPGKSDNILSYGDYCVSYSSKNIYKTTATSQFLFNSGTSESAYYKISDNYLGGYSGNVYKLSSFGKVISIKINSYYSACETKDYIVVYKDGELTAYNKSDYSEKGSYNYSKSFYGITSYNGKIAVINSDYTLDILNQSLFSSSNNSSLSSQPNGINLNAYKHTKKYIYVNQGTTIKEFKDKISYADYEIGFGGRKSGKIRTGTIVTFSKSNSKITYTFIVRGDVTGEGNVNSRDIKAMFNHLLSKEKLKGIYKLAGDLNSDKKISNSDLVRIARLIK